MRKSISVLIINSKDDLKRDDYETNVKYLISALSELNYEINSVSTLEQVENVKNELEQLLKISDYVIFIDKHVTKITLASVCEIYNVPLQHENNFDINKPSIPAIKLLKYDNSIKLLPVLYIGRLFIVRDINLKLINDHILKVYLQRFNAEQIFEKRLYFKNCEIDAFGSKSKCKCVEICFNKRDELIVVNIKSSKLAKLINFEKNIRRKYADYFLKEDVWFSESIYNRINFDHIQNAINCIENGIQRYGPNNIFLSFNGGKDCTVLLHLVLGVLKHKYPDYTDRLICMYIQSLNPFTEVDCFIDLISAYYNLEIITMTKTVKEGLKSFLERWPNMRACFMGTRRTDPYSENLEACQMTDLNWPQVMRISPLLDWHYTEIWDYLLYFQVPYCRLYDQGYTSLGSVNNTVRNPALLCGADSDTYLPAYKLSDGSKERDGRI